MVTKEPTNLRVKREPNGGCDRAPLLDLNEWRRSYVIASVLNQLGAPANLSRIDARHLWGNCFRVNIYCSVDKAGIVADMCLTDSFFVRLGDDGTLIANPPISAKYKRPGTAVKGRLAVSV
jgi:hypothetical protein